MKGDYRFLHETINFFIRNTPDNVALVYENKAYTYKELDRHIGNICRRLLRNALPFTGCAGQRIGILLGNRPEAIFSIYAISRAGGTFVILNDKIKPERLRQINDDAELSAIITDDNHSLPVNLHLYVHNVDAPDWNDDIGYSAPNEIDPGDYSSQAAIMYTSGSTGEPKGVICPHENMIAAVEIINTYLFHCKGSTILTALPLSHGYGLYQVLAPLAAGGMVILERSFMFALPILKKIKEWGVSGFAVVPTMLSMIFKIDGWEEYLGGLDYLTNAGAGLPVPYRQTLIHALPQTTIIPMYGQTECVRALYTPPVCASDDMLPYVKACGMPIPRTELFLVDEYINDVPDGSVGELVVRGPTVMAGYLNKPEETAKTFRTVLGERYLFTGDLFKRDDEGLYYYVGRKDDVVKVKGERTSPRELEDAMYQLNGVQQAFAVPVPDDVWGHQFILFIESDSLSSKDVKKHCKFNLESHLFPKEVFIYKNLPRNDNGKVDRKALKQIATELL